MVSVYLAARFGRREEMRRYRDELVALGIHVTSRWIDLEGEDAAAFERAAGECVLDLVTADVLVSFTEADQAAPGAARGGRHVELGIAVGINAIREYFRWNSMRRMRVFIVGPREHLFHFLPFVRQFETWEAARGELSPPSGVAKGGSSDGR